jgi:hypothetical protein
VPVKRKPSISTSKNGISVEMLMIMITGKVEMMNNQVIVAVAVAVYNPLYPYNYYYTDGREQLPW